MGNDLAGDGLEQRTLPGWQRRIHAGHATDRRLVEIAQGLQLLQGGIGFRQPGIQCAHRAGGRIGGSEEAVLQLLNQVGPGIGDRLDPARSADPRHTAGGIEQFQFRMQHVHL